MKDEDWTLDQDCTDLQAVDTFAVFTAAVDPLEVVFPAPPVVLDGVNIVDDGGIQSPVEGVWRMRLPGLGFEQVLDPAASIREPLPQAVRVHLPLDQLLPQHPLGDDAGPLAADGARVAQRPRVQE